MSIDMTSKKNMFWKNVSGGMVPLNSSSSKSKKNKANKDDNESDQGVAVNCIKFNQTPQKDNFFVSVDDGATLRLWDSNKGTLVAEEPRFSNGSMQTCAIEPLEGKLVACGGLDGKVHIYSINQQQKKEDKTIKMIQKQHELNGHQSLITCSGFLSQNYMVTGSDDSDLMLWDFEHTGRYLVKYSDHTFEVSSLDVFNRDGNIFASGSSDAQVRIWDIRMKQSCLRIFDKNSAGIGAVKFMPNK